MSENYVIGWVVVAWLVSFLVNIGYTVYDCVRMKDWYLLTDPMFLVTTVVIGPVGVFFVVMHAIHFTYPREPEWDEDLTW